MDLKKFFNNKEGQFILLVIFIIVALGLGRVVRFDFILWKEFLLSFPVWLSGLIFVLLYVSTTSFIWFGPKDVYRVCAAVIFGGFLSTLFVWLAEKIGQFNSFAIKPLD